MFWSLRFLNDFSSCFVNNIFIPFCVIKYLQLLSQEKFSRLGLFVHNVAAYFFAMADLIDLFSKG